MTDLETRLRALLAQAQTFVTDAPMEAVARAKLAEGEARAALAGADAETEAWLRPLHAYAEARITKYQAVLDGWLQENQERSDTFSQNERDRYVAPVPGPR